MTIEANLAAVLPVVTLPFSEPARSIRDILATFTSPISAFCRRNTCMSRMMLMTMMKQMMIRMMMKQLIKDDDEMTDEDLEHGVGVAPLAIGVRGVLRCQT
jgi:hypothetical protein